VSRFIIGTTSDIVTYVQEGSGVPEVVEAYLEAAQRAARLGGQELRRWQGRFAVKEKGPSDLVTEADFASQEIIRKELLTAFPEHGFLGEESGASTVGTDGYRWIVDPLDGTTNYVHGLPQFCVSIGLERAGELLVGVVYDPTAEECFAAGAGRGAMLNGKPISVSGVNDLSQALVAASFPPRVAPGHSSVTEFLAVMQRAQSTRRMGSSALNLSYVACGRLDAYWASETKTWDVAAGWLLVREAGGVVEGRHGPLDLTRPKFIAGANRELTSQLRQTIDGDG
jgi:myo-inositol-1(or 4)-monophosphatase